MSNKSKITGIEYINYKYDLLRKNILDFQYGAIIAGAIFELLFYILNWKYQFYNDKVAAYLIKLFLSFIIGWIAIQIFSDLNTRTEVMNSTKNLFCCLSTMILVIALSCNHCCYTVLWSFPALMVLFGGAFGNHKILRSMLVASILGQGLLFGLACLELKKIKSEYMISILLSMMASMAAFYISRLLADYIEKQLEDIVNYYDGEKELKQKLETEYLTGLLSRSAINNKLLQAVHDAYFYHKQLVCVAMIDIDYFKKVNDTYGHDKGDEVLKRLARVMKEYLDENMCAGRVGGEEFLIVFTNQSKLECKEIMNGMLRNFASQKFDFLPDNESLSFSGGMCWMSNEEMDEQKLRTYADKALYYSKEHGRNRITDFKPSMLDPR